MDFYQVLGVSRNAADSEIKAAFRKIALKYHPDRHSGATPETKAELAQKFKAATEAYDTLINSSKRSKYNSRSQPAYSAPHRTYDPHAYNYQGYRTHAPRTDSPFRFISFLARGMTQTDALFHAGMASLLVFGAIAAGGAGDYLWGRWNSGRLFEHIDTDGQQRRKANVRTRPARVDHMTSEPGPVSDRRFEGGPDFHRSKTAELLTSKDRSAMPAANPAIHRSTLDASISAAAEGNHDVHSVSPNAASHVAKQDRCNTNGLLNPIASETKHQQSGPVSGTAVSADDLDCDSVST